MAQIIDITQEVERHETAEKLDNLKRNQEIRGAMRESMRKNKISFKAPKPSRAKKPKTVTCNNKNIEKLEPEEIVYKYTHYLEALKTGIIPSMYNNLTFKDSTFEQKIKENKDYKYAINSILDFNVYDPYIGLIATLAGLSIEQYYDKKSEVITPEIKTVESNTENNNIIL